MTPQRSFVRVMGWTPESPRPAASLPAPASIMSSSSDLGVATHNQECSASEAMLKTILRSPLADKINRRAPSLRTQVDTKRLWPYPPDLATDALNVAVQSFGLRQSLV